MSYANLPARLSTEPCRNPHKKCHATGNSYQIENSLGAGGVAVAPGCNVIDAMAFAVKAPKFCCPSLKSLPGACGIKQY